MGWTKKTPSGRYKGCYRNAMRKEVSKTFDLKRDADTWWQEEEAKLRRGEWVDPKAGIVTVSEWCERALGLRVHLKPKTLDSYRSLLETVIIPDLGKIQIGRLDSMTVREWVARNVNRGLSASRVRQAYHLLSSCLEEAAASNLIGRNPCAGIQLPRLRRVEMGYLTAEQVSRVAEAVDERYRALVYLLAYGGLRWGEAVALRRSRIDLLHGRVQVTESMAEVRGVVHFGSTKTHKSRTVLMPSFLRAMLEGHLDSFCEGDADALVFTSPGGGPVRSANFRSRVWAPALVAAQVPTSTRLHDLRHTCATLLIAQGAAPLLVSRQLGHSSIQLTMDRYGHLFPEQFTQLADALDATFEQALTKRASSTPSSLSEARSVS